MNFIRSERAKVDGDIYNLDSGAITKLQQEELEFTRKIFRRLDPTNDVTSDLSYGGHDIDPYWNPFHEVKKMKDLVELEWEDYRKVQSIAEQKRTRAEIRRSLRQQSQYYNPFSKQFARFHGRELRKAPPKPFRLPDKHWELSPLQEKLNRERITWRDVDIIQHCIADNGYILPRRTTMLSRKKQQEMVRAVVKAQHMALLPYNWKPLDYQAMPLMDPLQWMVDRLTERVVESRDRRSRAMLRVMMERYPELNFRNFLRHEAKRAAKAAERKEDPPGI